MNAADQLELVGRLALAGLLGGMIGLEREIRGYPAGVRTIALVALGSALFTDASQLFSSNGTSVVLDPSRVAAQIVSGIGFLGAGVILREGYTVRGITTAATIWSAAAIGMAVGLKLYVVAILGAILIFAVLEARPLTRRVDSVIRPLIGETREEGEGEEEDGNPRPDRG